jgi:exodeoxyribonuclease VII small subunit
LCREGRDLVTYCAGELDAVGEGLRELRLDELAAKLEEAPAEPTEP